MYPPLASDESLETMLSRARPRLVALCARSVGDGQVAEDLAQETLYEAWRSASQLREPDRREAWLAGIARNVCRRWHRRNGREAARRLPRAGQPVDAGGPAEAEFDLADLASDYDLEAAFDHDELGRLLEQALHRLPETTRGLLVERYGLGLSQAEIAQRRALSEAAVAMRLQRARTSLQRTLTAEFRQALADYGLAPDPGENWTETRLWCPTCGERRMLGQFDTAAAGGRFAMRCPACHGNGLGTHADLTLPFFRALLSPLKAYKPAYTRLLSGMSRYCRQALAARTAPCLACGRPATLWIGDRGGGCGAQYEMRLDCPACGWVSNNSLHSLALALPEAQRFWRAHPRLRQWPTGVVEAAGTPTLVTRLRSVTDAAGLDIVTARDTFEVIGVYSTTST